MFTLQTLPNLEPAVSTKRLSLTRNGQIRYELNQEQAPLGERPGVTVRPVSYLNRLILCSGQTVYRGRTTAGMQELEQGAVAEEAHDRMEAGGRVTHSAGQ